MILKRLGAIALAVILVGGAWVVRDRVIEDNGGSGTDDPPRADREIVCVSDLREACDALDPVRRGRRVLGQDRFDDRVEEARRSGRHARGRTRPPERHDLHAGESDPFFVAVHGRGILEEAQRYAASGRGNRTLVEYAPKCS